MSFGLYILGFSFVIGGISWGLVIAGVKTSYIVITSIILLGIAILTGVTRTRGKD